MNWYKKAQNESFENSIENCQNISQIYEVLNKFNAEDIEHIEFKNAGEEIIAFTLDSIRYIIPLDYPQVEEASEWLSNIDYPDEYVDMIDFNKEFWEYIPLKLYHDTFENNISSIEKYGLNPKNKTRALSNNGTGNAIFTTEREESIYEYYPVIFEIDVSQMRKDGYMPQVSQEGPVKEYEAAQALASRIGLDEYNNDIETGIERDTYIFYDNIPAKYLTRIR